MILYLNMSHSLLTNSLVLSSVHASLRQGWLGVLTWKRAVNKEYLEYKPLWTSLFQLKKNYIPQIGSSR